MKNNPILSSIEIKEEMEHAEISSMAVRGCLVDSTKKLNRIY